MTSRHVMTLENPAGLLITPELLEQMGVSLCLSCFAGPCIH
jgi:hypothetical protein